MLSCSEQLNNLDEGDECAGIQYQQGTFILCQDCVTGIQVNCAGCIRLVMRVGHLVVDFAARSVVVSDQQGTDMQH
jgi:hypothetical protein